MRTETPYQRGPRLRRARWLLVLIAFVLIASSCRETKRADAEALINLINNERFSRGIPLLVENSQLADEADRWAKQMRNACTLSHRPNITSGLPPGWTAVAENVANHNSVGEAHALLMSSTGHRTNILNSAYTNVGVGIVSGNCPGKAALWVVEIFVRIP
jgi:uncharacterized protein YkwD